MTTSWSRIALLYAIGVLAAGQLGIVPPLVPELQRDLGLSLAGAGTAVSVITLVGAVLGLPAGGWSQRIGHARALAIGLAIMAVAAALCAAANDAATLLAGRTLAGIGYLLVVVAGPSLMAATAEPRHQPMTLSLWGTFVPTGIALAGLVAAGFADTRLAHDLRGRSRAAGRRGDRDGRRRAARRRRGARRGASRRPARLPLPCRLPPPSSASPCSSWPSPDCCRPGWSSAAVSRPPTPGASPPSPPPSASRAAFWPAR